MTATPAVSIVIACYNAGSTIGETIASIRRQTLRNWELICVDDGSTDDTAPNLAAASEADARIRVLRQQNSGPASARNAGVSAARAAHVFFIDADDLLLRPDAIEQLSGAARQADEHTIVTAGTDLLAGRGQRLGVPQFPAVADFSSAGLLRGNPLISVLALVPRTLLGERPFHAEMPPCEDWDLWLSLAGRGARCLRLPQVLFGYRLHEGNSSRRVDTLYAAGCRVLGRWGRHAESDGELRECQGRWSLGCGTLALAAGDLAATQRYLEDAADTQRVDAADLASRLHWAYAFTHGAKGETWRSHGADWLGDIERWLRTSALSASADAVIGALRGLAVDTAKQINAIRRWLADQRAVRSVVLYGVGTNGLKLLEALQTSAGAQDGAQLAPLPLAVADDGADELTFAALGLPQVYPRSWREWPQHTVVIVTPNNHAALTQTLIGAGGREGREFLVLSRLNLAAPVMAAEVE